MKNYKVIILIFLSLVLMLGIVGCFYISTEGISSHDIDTYKQLTEKYDMLPKLDEIGDDYEFNHLHKNSIIFQSNGYTLKIKYNDEDFLAQKNYINNNFIFQEKVIDYGESVEEIDTNYKHYGFNFKMLSLKNTTYVILNV